MLISGLTAILAVATGVSATATGVSAWHDYKTEQRREKAAAQAVTDDAELGVITSEDVAAECSNTIE